MLRLQRGHIYLGFGHSRYLNLATTPSVRIMYIMLNGILREHTSCALCYPLCWFSRVQSLFMPTPLSEKRPRLVSFLPSFVTLPGASQAPGLEAGCSFHRQFTDISQDQKPSSSRSAYQPPSSLYPSLVSALRLIFRLQEDEHRRHIPASHRCDVQAIQMF